MNSSKIIIKEFQKIIEPRQDTVIITIQELGLWIKSGKFMKHLFKYKDATVLLTHWKLTSKPLILSLAARLLTFGKCRIKDDQGFVLPINVSLLSLLFFNFFKDLFNRTHSLRKKKLEIKKLLQTIQTLASSLNLDMPPVYLRFEHIFSLTTGGSISHTAGVLNSLHYFLKPPVFLSSIAMPGINQNIEQHTLLPIQKFPDFKELPVLFYNDEFIKFSEVILKEKEVSFVYQRYSLYNYTGLRLAQSRRVPLVLEYNGSEIWVYKNWGKALKYETLAETIELLNLNAADVVVVVSQPLKDDLVDRGVDSGKILVNPNGVDPDLYSPDMESSNIRDQFNLGSKTVVGFIGTFGKWHGAEVLAKAFGLLIQQYPQYRDSTRLLMIGDGHTMSEVQRLLEVYEMTRESILTGMVPQEEGPAHLAACDILASPHVPNPDGTPFFGSPTKLFEYMAMEKGIVASDLDQIGEVLQHDHTAWLVKPGDAESLMHGSGATRSGRQIHMEGTHP